jgi:hypothetical protein
LKLEVKLGTLMIPNLNFVTNEQCLADIGVPPNPLGHAPSEQKIEVDAREGGVLHNAD